MASTKKPKASTVMIYNLIKTNALLARTIEAQQREIEMLNFRMAGWLDWEKNRKKFTNKKYLNRKLFERATPSNSYKAIKEGTDA